MSVSVIVPTIGREDRLRRAIDSIKEQTYPPEHVVIVDGSEERATKGVCHAADLPFEYTYIHQEGDNGLSEARNMGIGACSTELLAFLDDDDRWQPEKLERQVTAYDWTGCGLIFCGIRNVLPDGTVTNVKRAETVPDAETILTGSNIGTPSAVLARRSDVEAIGGFDEDLPSSEEWDFYIRMLQVTDAAAVPEPFVLKEYNPEGMSRNVERAERDLLRVFEKHREKYDPDLTTRFKANYHFTIGRRYAKSGATARARAHLLKSLSYKPRMNPVFYLLAACFGPTGYDAIRRHIKRH